MASAGFWQGMAEGTKSIGNAMAGRKERKARQKELETTNEARLAELELKDKFKKQQYEKEQDNKVRGELAILAAKGAEAYNNALSKGYAGEQARLESKKYLDQVKKVQEFYPDVMKRLGLEGNINADVVEDINRKPFISLQSGKDGEFVTFIDSSIMDKASDVNQARKGVLGVNLKGMSNVDLAKYMEEKKLDPSMAPLIFGRSGKMKSALEVKQGKEMHQAKLGLVEAQTGAQKRLGTKRGAAEGLTNVKKDILEKTGLKAAKSKIDLTNSRTVGNQIKTLLQGRDFSKMSEKEVQEVNKNLKDKGLPAINRKEVEKWGKADFKVAKDKLNTALELFEIRGDVKINQETGKIESISDEAKEVLDGMIKKNLKIDNLSLMPVIKNTSIPKNQRAAFKWLQKRFLDTSQKNTKNPGALMGGNSSGQTMTSTKQNVKSNEDYFSRLKAKAISNKK